MNYLFLLISILLFACSHPGKESALEIDLSCTDFKRGKFEIVDKKYNKRYLIERGIDYQSEETYNLESGDKISEPSYFKIKWTSECEFNLLIDTTKSKFDENDLYVNSKGGLNTRILKIENNCASLKTSLGEICFESVMCKLQ